MASQSSPRLRFCLCYLGSAVPLPVEAGRPLLLFRRRHSLLLREGCLRRLGPGAHRGRREGGIDKGLVAAHPAARLATVKFGEAHRGQSGLEAGPGLVRKVLAVQAPRGEGEGKGGGGMRVQRPLSSVALGS